MSQQKFYNLLDRVPRISHLWDRDTNSLKAKLFEAELGVMSPGEVCMAQFFASVWFGKNKKKKFSFDLVDAIAKIDLSEKELILEWMWSPFWP